MADVLVTFNRSSSMWFWVIALNPNTKAIWGSISKNASVSEGFYVKDFTLIYLMVFNSTFSCFCHTFSVWCNANNCEIIAWLVFQLTDVTANFYFCDTVAQWLQVTSLSKVQEQNSEQGVKNWGEITTLLDEKFFLSKSTFMTKWFNENVSSPVCQ